MVTEDLQEAELDQMAGTSKAEPVAKKRKLTSVDDVKCTYICMLEPTEYVNSSVSVSSFYVYFGNFEIILTPTGS